LSGLDSLTHGGHYAGVALPIAHPSMPKEDPARPTDDRLRVKIEPSIYKKISNQMPEHQKGRPLSFIVNDLLYAYFKKEVDSSNKISGHPGRFSYSNSSNSFEESVRETFLKPPVDVDHLDKALMHPIDVMKWQDEQGMKAKNESPAFLQFWDVYQTAPNKASNQSKKKAVLAWKEALKKQKPHLLIEAARRAVEDQVSKTAKDEWSAPFPDAYRWLRDECFTVHLEAHITAEQPKVIPGQTVL